MPRASLPPPGWLQAPLVEIYVPAAPATVGSYAGVFGGTVAAGHRLQLLIGERATLAHVRANAVLVAARDAHRLSRTVGELTVAGGDSLCYPDDPVAHDGGLYMTVRNW